MAEVTESIQTNQADLLARYLPDGKAWEGKWIEGSTINVMSSTQSEEYKLIASTRNTKGNFS